jgi:hypothetical protein
MSIKAMILGLVVAMIAFAVLAEEWRPVPDLEIEYEDDSVMFVVKQKALWPYVLGAFAITEVGTGYIVVDCNLHLFTIDGESVQRFTEKSAGEHMCWNAFGGMGL